MDKIQLEILTAVTKLIKQNSVTGLSIDDNNLIFERLDGSQDVVQLPEVEFPEIPEFDYERVYRTIDRKIDSIDYSELKESILASVPEPEKFDSDGLVESIKQYIDEVVIDKDSVLERISELESVEHITIDDIRDILDGYATNKSVARLSSDINNVREHVQENEIAIIEHLNKLDDAYNKISQTVSNLSFDTPEDNRVFVSDINSESGQLSVVMTDGTQKPLEKLLEPLVKRLILSTPTMITGGGGGGIAGDPGKPGLSAYQIAVRNGFVGTEQEWLDSLKAEGAVEMELTKRVDFVSDEVILIGEAEVNSIESDPVWRIKQANIFDGGNSVSILWANGSEEFQFIWDDRNNYTYS